MKRYIRSTYTDDHDPWAQTAFIDEEVPEAITAFIDTDIQDLDYTLVKEACNEFWRDYEKFPDGNSMESLDIKYDDDKRRFYKKYLDFAKQCRAYAKDLGRVSGYGRSDFEKLKMRDLLGAVDYHFPYGWKYA